MSKIIKYFFAFQLASILVLAQPALTSIDLSKSQKIFLPYSLHEVSGIAFSPEQKLFAHNDESGTLFEIDFENNKVVKVFALGWITIQRDFEDIAIVDDKFFLIVSNGDIYEFQEADNNKKVDYIKHNSVFSSKFEFEGLCYDPLSNSLLLVTKKYPGKDYDGMRTVFSFSLKTKRFLQVPRYKISLSELENGFDIKDFKPTGMTYNSISKSFMILSSDEKCIVELNSDGEILSAVSLPENNHTQPEGIAVNNLGELFIADEGNKGSGFITKYSLGIR